jgi:hypothetical protein
MEVLDLSPELTKGKIWRWSRAFFRWHGLARRYASRRHLKCMRSFSVLVERQRADPIAAEFLGAG